MAEVHIVILLWNDSSINKLKREHGLEFRQVEEAVVYDPNREARWVFDRKHGRRLSVVGSVEGQNKRILAFLDPVDEKEGIWKVRTAWEV